ncbi:hypothetical protein F4553_000754 [Allocatelliglobosispora scoriae]|uniref:Uncharacterized protein n=1 Tax=Allocatelliglobosispora scoriae TaxID=643052 RepID=A0A841BID5_9ACTN|nr:hypothetical protein [Allocatelliglobosispora scoriae]
MVRATLAVWLWLGAVDDLTVTQGAMSDAAIKQLYEDQRD